MTRRALLIGSPTGELTGMVNDVKAIASALTRWRFTDLRRCEGDEATRDGIVGAYERLIADTGPDDVAVVYYSGHGQLVSPPSAGRTDPIARANRQFIVPVDYEETTPDDFRGITAVELSVLLAQLTRKTTNAVVVLDCCHSALMSRDRGDLRIRQRQGTVRYDLDAHLRRRLGAGLRIDLTHPIANQEAVRLVACARDQYSYELPSGTGPDNIGLFTRSLVVALDEAEGARVSWSLLLDRVRRLVRAQVPHQRPEAEGPSERLLFETCGDDIPGSLRVVAEADGRVRLPGAPLLGVQPGDEFAIRPVSARGARDRIATVRIDHCDPTAASGRPVFTATRAALPPDARADRTRTVAPRIAVRVPDLLVPAVAASTFVRPAGADEDAPLVVTTDAAGGLTVSDRIGPLHAPRRPGPDLVETVVADLNRCARATILRTIREASLWSVDAPVVVEWGRVLDGRADPLPGAGAAITAGDTVYITVRNVGREPLHLSLVDIGTAYGVSLLTNHVPAGVLLPAGGEFVYGRDERDGRLVGVSPVWPDGLPAGAGRPETVLALLTSDPHDLSPLTHPGVRSKDRSGSPLTQMLGHLSAGQTREFPAMARRDTYSVHSVEFDLLPPAVRQVGA